MADFGASFWLQAAGYAASAATTVAGAERNEDYAYAAQRQANQKAKEERAVAQREAIEARRQKRIAQSRALAIARRGDDKTVLDIMEGLEERGEASALASLFEGESRARTIEEQARLSVKQARANRDSAYIEGAATLASGTGSLYGDYSEQTKKKRPKTTMDDSSSLYEQYASNSYGYGG